MFLIAPLTSHPTDAIVETQTVARPDFFLGVLRATISLAPARWRRPRLNFFESKTFAVLALVSYKTRHEKINLFWLVVRLMFLTK